MATRHIRQPKLTRLDRLAVNVGGVAFAIECLELVLVDKGVLRDNELMERIKLETLKRQEAIKHGNHGGISEANNGDAGFEARQQPGGEGGQSQSGEIGEIED